MVARFTVCDRNKLERALAGELAEPALNELSRHLQSCPHCRNELDVLAGGEKWFGQARQYLSSSNELVAVQEMTPPAGLAAYHSPAKSAGHSSDDEGGDEPEKISLDFLTPSDDPSKLGRLGNYEIESVIGRGGFGIVLKALDPALNRYVAIKALSGTLVSSSAARKRFAHEAKAAAAVVHDHVIPIHTIDTSSDVPFLVMPFITGRSLQERIDERGPLEGKEVLRIAMQTAQGLAAAHAQGLVHRDIKPANILLENGVERVRITDFGLARAVDDASQTQSGFIAGTPQYMAPEQARGEAIDARADLFSLGSLMYAMCTGHPPFRAETTLAVLRRICDDEPRGVRQINPDVPSWLAAIIEKLLSKSPQERFQSADEVAQLLEKWLAHLQQPTTIPPPVMVIAGKRGKSERLPVSRGRLAGVGAAALVILLSAALAAWQGGLFGGHGPDKRLGAQAGQPSVTPVSPATQQPATPTPTPVQARSSSAYVTPSSPRSALDAVDAELGRAWQETLSIQSALEQADAAGRSVADEINELTMRLEALERELLPPTQPAPARVAEPTLSSP